MKKLKALVFLVFVCSMSWAHQPDLSMMIIYQSADGKYFLETNSSLVAFESEIDFKFGKNSYKTPEEFRNLVIKHFKESFSLIVNGEDNLKFDNPKVILGHETKFIAQILNMPKSIKSLEIENGIFKDMPQNQCVLMFDGKDFPLQQHILSNQNNNAIKFKLENGSWKSEEYEEKKFSNFQLKIGIVVILTLLAGMVVFFKNRKNNVLTLNDI